MRGIKFDAGSCRTALRFDIETIAAGVLVAPWLLKKRGKGMKPKDRLTTA